MNYKNVKLSLVVVTVAVFLSPSFAQTVKEAQDIYNTAMIETTTNPEKAVKSFKKAIDICDRIGPEADATKGASQRRLATAYYNWGALLYGNMDLNGAVEIFEQAMIVSEKNGDDYVKDKVARSLHKIYYQLGTSELEAGRLDAALAACDKSLGLNPAYAKSYYLKGEIYQTKDEEQKAIAFLKKAIDAATNSKDHQTLRGARSSMVNYLHKKGSKANEKKQYDAAVDYLKRALPYAEGRIQTAMVYFEMATAYKGLNMTDEACDCFEKSSDGHLRETARSQIKVLNCN